MHRGKKYAAIKKGEAGESVTSKDQVTARVAIFEYKTDKDYFMNWKLT